MLLQFRSHIKSLVWEKSSKLIDSKKIFWISFVLLVLSRWIVLYFCQYPGELTTDSISQMSQLMSGTYSNHHPFYHTMVIKCFVDLGLNIFNDINAAVATYSFFQILFTAMCFSFAVSTMAKMEAPRWMIITTMSFFIMMPYHILYAITMWKDIMFGCFILLFVTFVYRCIKDIGNNIFNYIMLAISSMGTCLFRSNGFFAFVILTFTFIMLWKLKNRRMLVIFASAIVLSFIMKHGVLAKLGVTQPDTIESLSIPAQQIARVVYEGCELDDWERATLSEIIDIGQIAENYAPYISDPIKGLVRQKGNQHLIVDKKGDYIKLYFSLGFKYPMVYMRGWIDETRGYWNAGYEYWRWSCGVHDNSLGIERTTRSISLDRKLREYLWLFTNVQGLRLFLSIGLFIWTDILMLMIALLRKDKVGAFVSLPILVVVISLLVATPVFSEFRYIYAAFCTLPMVMAIALRPIEEERVEAING